MTRSLTLALLLSALALPVLAAETVVEGMAGDCPGRKAARSAEPVVAGDATAASAATRSTRSGGEAGAQPQRIRPRWQSFLPGMMR